MNIYRYLVVYKTLLRMNFSALVSYRGNMVSSVLASLSWGLFSLYSVILLTYRSTSIFGWDRDELLLLNGIYGILIGVFHLLFSWNFYRFSEIIHRGDLDTVLLKPLDSQFLVSCWLFTYATLSRILAASVYTIYMIHALRLPLTLPLIAGFLVVSFSGLLLLYSVWFIVITLTVWFTRLSNLVELMFTITGTARYPQEIIHQASGYLFFFLFPLTIVISLPTKTLLHRVSAGELSVLWLFAVTLFIVSRKFWRFALRSYTSASS